MTRFISSTARGTIGALATLFVVAALSQTAFALPHFPSWPPKDNDPPTGPTNPGPSTPGGAVPEIDPAAATGALTLLVTGLAMCRKPRRKTA